MSSLKERLNKKGLSRLVTLAIVILVVLAAVSLVSMFFLRFTAEKSELTDVQIRLLSERYGVDKASLTNPLDSTDSNYISLEVTQFSGSQTLDVEVIQGQQPYVDLVSVSDLSDTMYCPIGSPYPTCLPNGNEQKINILKVVTKGFIDEFLSNLLNGRAGLVVFGNDAQISSDLTNDGQHLKDTIDNDWVNLDATCTCCGINKAREVFSLQSSLEKSKILLLMSDGQASQSCTPGLPGLGLEVATRDALKAAVDLCNDEGNADLKIYTIGFDIVENSPAEMNMKDIAAACGPNKGEYFRAADTQGLLDAYTDISEQIKSSTSLSRSSEFLLFVFKDASGQLVHIDKKSEFPLSLYIPKGYEFTLPADRVNKNPIASVEIYPGAYLQNGQEVIGALMDIYSF